MRRRGPLVSTAALIARPTLSFGRTRRWPSAEICNRRASTLKRPARHAAGPAKVAARRLGKTHTKVAIEWQALDAPAEGPSTQGMSAGGHARSAAMWSVTTRAAIGWSGGKDSCLALMRAAELGLRVDTLLTTVDPGGLSKSHALPLELIAAQAQAMGHGCQ